VQRADQVHDRLWDIQTTRATSQTILAVIFGGLANILSGGISMATGAGDAGNITSVAGGALEVLFGTSANFTKVRQEFSHPRNHLAAVWNGSPQSEFFSQRAWRFLTEPGIRGLEEHRLGRKRGSWERLDRVAKKHGSLYCSGPGASMTVKNCMSAKPCSNSLNPAFS